MSTSFLDAVFIIATAAVCTFVTRLLPFVLFGGKRGMPKAVKYLAAVLPSAIIAVLVVYCLKGLVPLQWPKGIAELASVAVVIVLHLWKRNTLVSIAGGTILYMVLIRLI
ncbi:MAG: branched-chain amino acid transporter AzlD [Clostridiales bacterium]|jgi:branched-subunit amino acid transport protein AzlD|nr:branched-chain amino acid transporter AzlD [Clostridiales bacterium]